MTSELEETLGAWSNPRGIYLFSNTLYTTCLQGDVETVYTAFP